MKNRTGSRSCSVMGFTLILAGLNFSILVPKGTRINDEGLSMFILSQGVKGLVLSTEYVKSKSCDPARESGISSCIAWPNTIQNKGDGWM